jgi:hypothetical protein
MGGGRHRPAAGRRGAPRARARPPPRPWARDRSQETADAGAAAASSRVSAAGWARLRRRPARLRRPWGTSRHATRPGSSASPRTARRATITIDDTFEAGIALVGTEVKSVREGRINLRDSYVEVKGTAHAPELFLTGAHISPYDQGNIWNHDPLRPRKLLLHRAEMTAGRQGREKGYTSCRPRCTRTGAPCRDRSGARQAL